MLAIAAALTIASCGSSSDSTETLTPVDPATADTAATIVDPEPADAEATAAGDDATADELADDTGNDDTDDTAATAEPLAGTYLVEVIEALPHDSTAYTQGLELDGDRLLETTGLYGRSERRWIDPSSGDVVTSVQLPDEFFGEGATVVNGEILQLTWQAETLLVNDADTLVETGRGSYDGEGWGLCFDGEHVIMSNGSATLTVRDATTFEIVRSVVVVDGNGDPVDRLNELECVGGQVLANVYGLDSIAVIDPTTGSVAATIDASVLRPANAPADDFDYVLNGIAHRADTDTYYLTGKWWDVLYEVRLVTS